MTQDGARRSRSVAAPNIVEHPANLSTQQRFDLLGRAGRTLWFTGLSGSGKSTLAYAFEEQLVRCQIPAFVLDGDNLRFGLNSDLGFSPSDRKENIRRVGHVAALMAAAGVTVLASFVSPYRSDRDLVRQLHEGLGFAEVYVSTPLEVCEGRDTKGLYARARTGEISDLSGVSAPYETPLDPELTLDTAELSLSQCLKLLNGLV